VPVGARAAGVRRRSQLPQQPQLLERRLELGAELAPLDAFERAERCLDGRPLPLAGEVRAQPRTEVSRPPDVERLAVLVTEDVDARRARRLGNEGALHMQAPRPRSSQLGEIADRPGPPLLRQPDQREQDLRRCLRVGERAMARLDRGPEEVGERGEPDASHPAAQEAAGKPHGVDDWRRDPPSGQTFDLPVEEGEVEAGVVGNEHRVARERNEPAHRRLRSRRADQDVRRDAGELRDGRRQRHTRVDQGLERVPELQLGDTLGSDLADPILSGGEPGRLEVEDDERGALEQDVVGSGACPPDRVSVPRQPRVLADDVVEQRARDRRRRATEREQHARRLMGRHGAMPRRHELGETIGGVERELHSPRR
jgi:hypothetical protein